MWDALGMAEHTVHLPHPSTDGITVGRCDCGWLLTYKWGEHGEAAASASDHIEQATQSEPIELSEMSGKRTVIPGRSL